MNKHSAQKGSSTLFNDKKYRYLLYVHKPTFFLKQLVQTATSFLFVF